MLCLAYRIWLYYFHSSSTCRAMSRTRVIDKEVWTQLSKIYEWPCFEKCVWCYLLIINMFKEWFVTLDDRWRFSVGAVRKVTTAMRYEWVDQTVNCIWIIRRQRFLLFVCICIDSQFQRGEKMLVDYHIRCQSEEKLPPQTVEIVWYVE